MPIDPRREVGGVGETVAVLHLSLGLLNREVSDQMLGVVEAKRGACHHLADHCHRARPLKVEDVGPDAQVRKRRPRLPDGDGRMSQEALPGQVGLAKTRLDGVFLCLAKEIHGD